MGQLWAVNSLGGYLSAKNLDKYLRMQLVPEYKFRQFCDYKDASMQGKKKGDTYHWDVFSRIATGGGTLVETNTIPESQFTITQGTLTITEYGNSVPYTGKVEDLSELDVKNMINKVLKDDVKDTLDEAAYNEFNETLLRVYPTDSTSTTAVTLTTNGTVGGTSSKALLKGHIGAIVDLMKERNIPPYTGGDYYALSWPSTYRSLKNDLQSVYQYTTEGFGMIMNGEIGRFENVRFVEQTSIAKAGTTYTDWAFFFGGDTVAEAIAVPEEIRAKIPTDYGRSKGVAWYYLGGFGLIHSDVTNSRIIKWETRA